MKSFYLYLACVLLLSIGCRHETRATDSQRTVPAVDHILLEVKDLDRSVKFYHDELGLKIKGDREILPRWKGLTSAFIFGQNTRNGARRRLTAGVRHKGCIRILFFRT